MIFKVSTPLLILLLGASLPGCLALVNEFVDDRLDFIYPGTTLLQLIRTRGFLADEFTFITPDHYQLAIVRASSPLARPGTRKYPILFLHGTFTTCATLSANSAHVRPRPLHETIQPDGMSPTELWAALEDEPSRKSLPFLAMNFGYEVYLLSRRGYTPGSRRKLDRPNRTLADALAAVPDSLVGNGFTPIDFGRPSRVPISSVNSSQVTSSGAEPRPDLASLLKLPLTSLFEALGSLIKLPAQLANLADNQPLQQQFIDTFDPDFWSFSLDEQAQLDLPSAIDFVLAKSNATKTHVLGYSVGSSIALMSLSFRPELADKIGRAVLWAPAVTLGSKMDAVNLFRLLLLPIVQGYTGPLLFLFQVAPIQTALQQVCSTQLAQRTLCESVFDLLTGFSAGQEPVLQSFLATALESTPSGELIHLSQFAVSERPCMFKFNTDEKNVEKYGQKEPPCYDLANIRLRNISAYVGLDDNLVAPNDLATTVAQMSVPVEVTLIGGSKLHFNHAGFLLHDHMDRLAIVPSLLDFERSDAIARAA